MPPAGGLVGPPVACGVDPLPPGLGPQPPQQQDGVNRDGAEWGTFRNPCLDLFLADGSTPKQRLRDLLADAWKHDAELTLKLICQLRDVGATGKGDREGFYTAALWMHQAHPHTLTINLSAFAMFGYVKDLPELLYRLVKGPDVREREKAKAEAWKTKAKAEAEAKEAEAKVAAAAPVLTRSSGRKRARDDPAPCAVDEAEEIQVDDDQKAGSKTVSKVAMDAAQALSMYKNDKSYKHLFDCVAEFFARRLESDLEMLRAKKKSKIGLAAKWCPLVDSAFDRATLLCEAIARRLFPWDDTNEEDDRKNVYLALRRLRREVLVPLRNALKLPEVYICSQRWSEVPYDRVAKLAMERYKEHFMKHDGERFTEFMESRGAPSYRPRNFTQKNLAEDAYTIPVHTMISKIARRSDSGGKSMYYTISWRALVKDLKSKGLFHNCVAVCNLSKSMKGKTRNVCLAIGLLLAEVGFDDTPTPWKNSVWPFGMRPKCYFLSETSGDRRIAELDNLWSQCDNKIDLRAVFQNMLQGACQLRLGQEAMVRTIFVITDKEFDESIARPWRKDYKEVCEMFTKCELGSVVPQVVFWNLGGQRSAALTETKDGVMRVSGFSDTFFRLFLENGGIVTPEDEMHGSIAADAYNSLIVID